MEGRRVDIKCNGNPDSSWEMVVGHHIIRLLPGIFGWEYVGRATSAMHPAWASDMPVFWKLFVLHHLGARIVTLKRLPEIECFGNGRPLASYLSFSSDLDMPATTCGSDWNQPNFRTVVEEMIVKSCCDEVIGRGVFFSPVLSAMFLYSWSAHPHTLTRSLSKSWTLHLMEYLNTPCVWVSEALHFEKAIQLWYSLTNLLLYMWLPCSLTESRSCKKWDKQSSCGHPECRSAAQQGCPTTWNP